MPLSTAAWNAPSADWPSLFRYGLVALAVAFVLYLVFTGIDYLTGTDRTRPCLVEAKRYEPARTEVRIETECGCDGETNLVCRTEDVPERYTLLLCVDGRGVDYDVDAASYASVREGQEIDLAFRYGGMTGRRY